MIYFTNEEKEAFNNFLSTPIGKKIFRKWGALSGMYVVFDHADDKRALVEKGKKDFFIIGICDNLEPDTLREIES